MQFSLARVPIILGTAHQKAVVLNTKQKHTVLNFKHYYNLDIWYILYLYWNMNTHPSVLKLKCSQSQSTKCFMEVRLVSVSSTEKLDNLSIKRCHLKVLFLKLYRNSYHPTFHLFCFWIYIFSSTEFDKKVFPCNAVLVWNELNIFPPSSQFNLFL